MMSYSRRILVGQCAGSDTLRAQALVHHIKAGNNIPGLGDLWGVETQQGRGDRGCKGGCCLHGRRYAQIAHPRLSGPFLRFCA